MKSLLTFFLAKSLLLLFLMPLGCATTQTVDGFDLATAITDFKLNVSSSTVSGSMRNDTFYVKVPFGSDINNVSPIFSLPSGAVSTPLSSSNVVPQNFGFEINVRNGVYLRKYHVSLSIEKPIIEFKPRFSNYKNLFTIGDIINPHLFLIKNAVKKEDAYKTIFITINQKNYFGRISVYKDSVFIGFGTGELRFKDFQALFSNINLSLSLSPKSLNRVEQSEIFRLNKRPYGEIYTWRDLEAIKLNLDGDYTLIHNIIFPVAGTKGFPQEGFSQISPDTNDILIGYQGQSFTGILDGDNHKIESLLINRKTHDFVGMFGQIETATVQNLSITVDSVVGKSHVGVIAGSVSNSKIHRVGIENNSSIVCYENIAGALFGESFNCKISECYSKADVIGYARVGGFIGACQSDTIVDSYSSGSILCYIQESGGFSGYSSSSITRCYSTAQKKPESSDLLVGGFIGHDVGLSKVKSSYWEKEGSGFKYSNTAFSITSRNNLVFSNGLYQDGSNLVFQDWNFSGDNAVWEPSTDKKFPILKWELLPN